jgi:hypothetical protein
MLIAMIASTLAARQVVEGAAHDARRDALL